MAMTMTMTNAMKMVTMKYIVYPRIETPYKKTSTVK